MKTINPLLKTDSYKLSHKDMYPEELTFVQSNYTNRGSRVPGVNHVVHFGLQAFLRELQVDFDHFFSLSKNFVVEEYKRKTSSFVSPGFSLKEIEDLHDLGYLPLRFLSPYEGTLVPIKVPSILIESTHPDFAWLVNYFETNLSASIWHPSTVATIAWDYRRILDKAARETGGPAEAVNFQLHDFSYRGQVNAEAAMASGAAHLLSFFGSDVVPVIDYVEEYYPETVPHDGHLTAEPEMGGLIAASVPATEHSVMCAHGQDGEFETFEKLLDKYPEGILSVVADTWDLFAVLTDFLPRLKDKILARNGKLVIRPDSGDPADIICGTSRLTGIDGAWDSPEEKGAIRLLWEIFGGTVNEKNFMELDSHIGLIYGDSITRERMLDINARLAQKGFASTNWVAGVGSYSYQYVTRDTFGSAVKATYVEIDGVGRNIQKNPKTDSGLKKSATGRLAVLSKMNGTPYLVEKATPEQRAGSLLQPVWEDGVFLRTQSFSHVRETLKRSTAILERNGSLS